MVTKKNIPPSKLHKMSFNFPENERQSQTKNTSLPSHSSKTAEPVDLNKNGFMTTSSQPKEMFSEVDLERRAKGIPDIVTIRTWKSPELRQAKTEHNAPSTIEHVEQQALSIFNQRFGKNPENLVGVPGQIYLFGNGSEHRDGASLTMTIDRAIVIAFRPTKEKNIALYSEKRSLFIGSIDTIENGTEEKNSHIVRSIAKVLCDQEINAKGFEGVVVGNIPEGAGLSSSTAFHLALVKAFLKSTDTPHQAKPEEIALLAKQSNKTLPSEHASLFPFLTCTNGKEDHAMFIERFPDKAIPEIRQIALPKGYSFLVLDTGTRLKHKNEQHNSSKTKIAFEALPLYHLLNMTDEDITRLTTADGEETTIRKHRHFLTENERAKDALLPLGLNDIHSLGSLFQFSHESLQEDAFVVSEQLDTIVNIALEHEAIGAKMIGREPGISAIALVSNDRKKDIMKSIEQSYNQRHAPYKCNIFECKPSNGAWEKELNKNDTEGK